ncbi:MAG: cysteine desulfurase, partial [Bacteroidetes bacterium]
MSNADFGLHSLRLSEFGIRSSIQYLCIWMQPLIYLDHNATTPVDQQVLEIMLPFFSQDFGNAASLTHTFGLAAARAVEKARGQVAEFIGADPQEITFTSGATEAINLAIKGVYETYAGKGKHIITAQTEHKAVLDTCAYLEKKGAGITRLPVDREGLVDLQELEKSIRPDTILVCIMLANNETGVIQPLAGISKITRSRGCILMSDATQAAGKIRVDVN